MSGSCAEFGSAFQKLFALLFASEILAIAEYSGLSLRDTISRYALPGWIRFRRWRGDLDDEVRHRIARLKCLTEDWISVHRTAHQLGMRTTATMMFGVARATNTH